MISKKYINTISIIRKNIWLMIFIIISFVFFIKLISNPQAIIYDASGYHYFGDLLYKNKFDVLNLDFENRTYVFPLLISILISIANALKINEFYFIYFFNYFIFLVSILLVNRVIKQKNKNVSSIFLILSSFNIINLSFTNTILTESLVIFFVCSLFYLLNSNLNNKIVLFLIGAISSLNVLARPSNAILFVCVFIYILFISNKKLLIYFLVPVIIFFGISSINVYNIDHRIGLFTNKTQGIYDMQIREGVKYSKYETSVDKNYRNASVFYANQLAMDIYNENCKKSVSCMMSYFFKDPLEYSLILGIHFFNLFDRIYIQTYVENINKIDKFLIIYNYFTISSVICYFLFILDSKIFKKHIKILSSFFILFIGTIFIYIPTVVESRFSSSLFPLLTMISSFYYFSLFKNQNNKIKKKIIATQLLIILSFLVFSYLVRQSIILYPV